MTDDDIKAARALCDRATPGPWKFLPGSFKGGGAHVLTGAADGEHWSHHAIVVSHFFYAGDAADLTLAADARTLLPAALDALESTRRELAISHQDASQLSGDANRALRDLKERMFKKIERYERDAEALTVDLAATKAALAEAMDALDAIAANAYFQPNEFARRKVAALKAKVQP